MSRLAAATDTPVALNPCRAPGRSPHGVSRLDVAVTGLLTTGPCCEVVPHEVVDVSSAVKGGLDLVHLVDLASSELASLPERASHGGVSLPAVIPSLSGSSSSAFAVSAVVADCGLDLMESHSRCELKENLPVQKSPFASLLLSTGVDQRCRQLAPEEGGLSSACDAPISSLVSTDRPSSSHLAASSGSPPSLRALAILPIAFG